MTFRQTVERDTYPPRDEALVPFAGVPLAELVAGFSIEATPKQLQRHNQLAALLPAGTSVYVPFLPRASIRDSADACRRLSAVGLKAVPHLAARATTGRVQLAESLSRLADAGADSLLLIAGDRRRPAGAYKSTLEILDTGLLQRCGFRSLGVAGHPEGHHAAGEDRLFDALREKLTYARESASHVWIVTQFAFAAEPVSRWLARLREEGIELPVRVGLPGPAKVQTLLKYAVQCGAGASSQMLSRRPGAVSRLLNRWTPDDMLRDLARYAGDRRANAELAIAGIHVFPFGGLIDSIEYFTRQ